MNIVSACRRAGVTCQAAAGALFAEPRPHGLLSGRDWQFLLIGAAAAFCIYVAAQWASGLPVWRRLVQRFIWWKDGVQPEATPVGMPLTLLTCSVHDAWEIPSAPLKIWHLTATIAEKISDVLQVGL